MSFGLCLTLFALAGVAADKLKRLSAAEIETQMVGKIITDDVHWSDSLRKDGTLESSDMGKRTSGTWSIDHGELCLTRDEAKGRNRNCYEIWRLDDQVEYRRDGITLMQGYLRGK